MASSIPTLPIRNWSAPSPGRRTTRCHAAPSGARFCATGQGRHRHEPRYGAPRDTRAAGSRRRARSPRCGRCRSHQGFPGSRPVRRPRLAPGGCRSHHHLDCVPESQSGFPVQQQPGQFAVRLLDRGRDRARHRLHPDGRRDRSVGRLGQRLRVGHGRRALGQSGMAGVGGDRGRAAGRRRHRWTVRRAVQSVRDAEFRLDTRGPARGSRPAALFPGGNRIDQPAVRLALGGFRPDAGDIAGRRLRARRVVRRRDLRDRVSHRRPQEAGGPVGPIPRQFAGARGSDHGGSRTRRVLSQPGSRRAVDVRSVRRHGRGDELRAGAHPMGARDERGGRQPRGGAPRRHRCAADLYDGLRAVRDAGRGWRHSLGGAPGVRQPAGRHRRRQPQCHRRGCDRRHQPVRWPGQRLFSIARDHRHSIDRQRPDAARSVIVASVHDHRRGAGRRRHRRLAGPPLACVPWPGLSYKSNKKQEHHESQTVRKSGRHHRRGFGDRSRMREHPAAGGCARRADRPRRSGAEFRLCQARP